MREIDGCTSCGETERTVVCEYNRLIFVDDLWRSDLARYDYALCHGCGLVYATRRPEREEYDFLYGRFNEFLVRDPGRALFNTPELCTETAERIDREYVPWWKVRRANLKGRRIRKRLSHELDDCVAYLPALIQHVPLKGARVLHLRAKSSAFADVLNGLLGTAGVDVVTLFPPHKYLVEKSRGVRAEASLDYEDLKIPFEGRYDLILENHILLHALDIAETFGVFRAHLNDGGSIFLHKELDDRRLFSSNLFAQLRPFHFQQYDLATLTRMLRLHGFDVAMLDFLEERRSEIIGVARMRAEAAPEVARITRAELRSRLRMYRQWRDESILSLPLELSAELFGDELPSIWKRVVARGPYKLRGNGEPKGFRYFQEAGLTFAKSEWSMATRQPSTLWWNRLMSRLARGALRLLGAPMSVVKRTRRWVRRVSRQFKTPMSAGKPS
ncbi:MAG: class I SAM-dependent methyltransferase [Hyphomicrobiales bacterium]|nr:class I SAM-dependent methyltransferase [Hyphomicrobiales bacterium]